VLPRAKRLDMPSSNDEFPPLPHDACFVVTIHCVIAIALVFILTLKPPMQVRSSEVIDLLLSLYTTYSVVLYLVARWWRPSLPDVLKPWIDVSWALGLMALSRERILIGVVIESPLKESRHADNYRAAGPDLNHRRPSDRGRLLAPFTREQAEAEGGWGNP